MFHRWLHPVARQPWDGHADRVPSDRGCPPGFCPWGVADVFVPPSA